MYILYVVYVQAVDVGDVVVRAIFTCALVELCNAVVNAPSTTKQQTCIHRECAHVRRPSLVVVPLSTLRNWEREFATWAPQMRTVTFIGNAAARNIVREYELYAPAGRGGRSTPPVGGRSERTGRVLPDVVLTSYEMLIVESRCVGLSVNSECGTWLWAGTDSTTRGTVVVDLVYASNVHHTHRAVSSSASTLRCSSWTKAID